MIVEVPVDGSNELVVRYNAWQFRQILARGVHGVLLCQAESADAVRAFVESCRYPIHKVGVGRGLGIGTRGRGSEPAAARVWGLSPEEYMDLADPWPLNPHGELLLGVKIESLEGVSNVEQILSVPGIGFAEMGPGDLGLVLGYKQVPREPYPPEMQDARERVFAAPCAWRHCVSGDLHPREYRAQDRRRRPRHCWHREETARVGRAHTQRTMPV